jgi:hypothetical protein
MIRIGFVDLDTSHPETFIKLLNELGGVKVSAVYDSGDVRPQGYAKSFAQKYDIAKVAASLSDMIDRIDCVMILGVNWDTHLQRARPFLDAGIPVFIDKPVFGKLTDGYMLDKIAKINKVALMGGSSIRYDDNVKALQKKSVGLTICTAFASGPNDFFYYGIHTVELFHSVLQGKVEKVRSCGSQRELFEIDYSNKTVVWLQLESSAPFFLSIFPENGQVLTVRADSPSRLSRMLKEFIKMVKTGTSPIPFSSTIETTAIMIAVHKARTTSEYVYIEDIDLNEGPDGESYTKQYALRK